MTMSRSSISRCSLTWITTVCFLGGCSGTESEHDADTSSGGSGTGSVFDGPAHTGGLPATGGSPSSGGEATTTGGMATGGAANGTGGALSHGGQDMTSSGGMGSGGRSEGSGASTSSGGQDSSGGAEGSGGSAAVPGQISLSDPVPGFASVGGKTSGGGTDLAQAIFVDSMDSLRDAADGSSPALILVEPGDYSGTLSPGANKTIIGVEPGIKISGNINISGADKSNIIIRNLAVQGLRCNSYDECKEGDDAVYIGNGAHHVWLDHLDISDGQDGNCDITKEGDYVTVSWTHFHYTYDKEHRFSNLIAGSDDETQSVGKLRITYMTSHFGQRIDQRQPRGRFGNIHMLNNYHKTGGSQIHGVGKDMALIAENSVYEESGSIWTDMGSPRGWKGVGNIGSGQGLGDSRGSVFEIPYEYEKMPASDVVEALLSAECGAGNTCILSR